MNPIERIMDKLLEALEKDYLVDLSKLQTETTMEILRIADKYGIDRNKLATEAARAFVDVLLGTDFNKVDVVK